jgi:hypothetical protein
MSPFGPTFNNDTYSWNQAWNSNTHRRQYGSPSSGSSTEAILCTITILFCTLLLETIAHISFEKCDTATMSQSTDDESLLLPEYMAESARPEQLAAPSAEAAHDRRTPKPNDAVRVRLFVPSPGPSTRALRLFPALMFMYPAAAALGIRISSATSGVHANWTAIVLFDILPFICAAFALLRIITELALEHLGTGLGYDRGSGAFVWLPFMPFSMFIALLPWETMDAWYVKEFMSLDDGEGRGRVGGEDSRDEELGLVEGMDGSEDERLRSDWSPGYDEAVNAKNNVEARGQVEEVH